MALGHDARMDEVDESAYLAGYWQAMADSELGPCLIEGCPTRRARRLVNDRSEESLGLATVPSDSRDPGAPRHPGIEPVVLGGVAQPHVTGSPDGTMARG